MLDWEFELAVFISDASHLGLETVRINGTKMHVLVLT